MTIEVGVLLVGAAAFGAAAALVGFGAALGRAQPEVRSRWLRGTVWTLAGATGLLLFAFLALAVADSLGGDKRDALFGTTDGAFRFALALLLFALLAPALLLGVAYLVAMVRLFAIASAAEPPSEQASANARLASWPVFATLIGLPLFAFVADGELAVENLAAIVRHVSRDAVGIWVVDGVLFIVAVVAAVLVRRRRGRAAAILLGVSALGWPIVVVLRATGSVTQDALVRTGAWYVVMLLALALSMILDRSAGRARDTDRLERKALPVPPSDVRRASRRGHVVGLAIVVVGATAAVAWLLILDAQRPSAPNVVALVALPGSDQTSLDARPYALYLAHGAGTRDLEQGIQVTGPAGDVPVELFEDAGATWGLGEQGWTAYDGKPFAIIEPPVAGRHQIDAKVPSSWQFGLREPLEIAVGDPPPPTPRLAIWSAELLAALSVAIGGVLIVVTGLRRHLPARVPRVALGPSPR